MITTVPNLDEKRPIETHPYELLKITKFNKRSLFVLKKEFPLYRESEQIANPLSKKIEYIEVKERSLLTEIIKDFDEDIDPNSSLKKRFLYIVRANCKFPLRRSNT